MKKQQPENKITVGHLIAKMSRDANPTPVARKTPDQIINELIDLLKTPLKKKVKSHRALIMALKSQGFIPCKKRNLLAQAIRNKLEQKYTSCKIDHTCAFGFQTQDLLIITQPYKSFTATNIKEIEMSGGIILKTHPTWGTHDICEPIAIIFSHKAVGYFFRS